MKYLILGFSAIMLSSMIIIGVPEFMVTVIGVLLGIAVIGEALS